MKYHLTGKDSPTIKFIKKLIESGHQGKETPTQDNPTKKYNRDLYLGYFDKIINPKINEMITKIKLKLPCKTSTGSRVKKFHQF